MINCKDESATDCWKEGLLELQIWMQNNLAKPGLTEAVEHYLQFWRDPNYSAGIEIEEEITNLMQAQSEKGWDVFCFGIVDQL